MDSAQCMRCEWDSFTAHWVVLFSLELKKNTPNLQSDISRRHLLLTCENSFHFNVVSDIPFSGFTMKYTEPFELWISEQPFDVSSFWTKFNNHNKDEGNRSNFSLCLLLSKALHGLPHCILPRSPHRDLLKCPKANIISYRWQAISTPAIAALSSEGIH